MATPAFGRLAMTRGGGMATPAFGRLAMTRGGEMVTSRTLLWEAKASPTSKKKTLRAMTAWLNGGRRV